MVEDSDIGPRNSALTIFSLAEFVYMSCKIFLLRGANLYLILRIITYFIMGGEIYNSISIPLLFGSFGMCLIIFVAYRAVLLFRIKRMEQFWDQTDTQVLTRGAAGKRMFTNTKIQNMKVGDIILLRARSTCPADVLIIDTAEQRHSEKVAFVNESRITGRRVLTVKTGIKNMNPVKTVKNIKSGPMEGIKKVLRRLRGKIEFDSPSPDLVNFSGKFILTNDPKVYPVTKDNILFCGSRLHTAWVYGYVLYNGLNTKIIQKNFSDQRMNGLKGFKKHVESILDRVAFAYFAIAVIEVFLLFLSLLIIFKDSTSFMQELTDKGSSKLSFYIMQSFRILGPISFPLAPVMLNMVLDIYNLVFGVKCENSTDNYQEEAPEQKQRNSIFFLDNQTTLDHKREPRNELKSINSDIKEGATERGLMSSSKNNSHSNFDSIEGSSASLRKTFTIHRPLRHSPSIALEAEDLKKSTKIINKGDRDNPVALSDTQSSSMNGLLFGRSNKLIKVTDFSVLSELGNINHVVFDKTDTLVTKKVVITNLATNHRLYEIDVGTILPMYEDVKANPAKYQNIDDYDDVMKKKDDENYSEKSQEFYNEIKGDYDPEIFEEDTNFEHVIKKIENPGYLTRRNSDDIPPEERDSSLNDSIATSVKNPFGSMDKIERKLTRLPTKRVNFKSYGSNRSIGKVTPNDMKAGSEYAVILNDIAKKEKIFKEKVLNKLNPNIIKRGSVYNRKYPTIQSVGSSDESSNSVDIEDLDGSNLDIKLNINPSKKHAQEDFLIDYYNKEDTLMEMIVCMAICHEAKIDSQGKVKCLREEEHAMLNFCKELGITFKREDSNSSIYYKIIQIKQEGKLSSILNIAGLNSFTDRNRMSIVVNDPRKGKDSYTLYVSGSPEGMAGTMLLNIHEMNNYKKLLMSFKSQGFKQLVFAKKELPRQVGQSYIKTFQLVRKSRKEQRENFEKLAMEIEKNLDFLGGIGYKYDLMEGAVDIIKNLQKAEINISVLTGDRLENTMPLIRALKISDTDFRDSSQFYSLRFKTLNDAYKEINRYMENIYEKMREENVENMVVRTTSKSEMQSLESRALRENEGDKIIDHKAHNSLSKSLLIGGSTVDLILSDPQLNQHFKFMLIFAKTVIGYSLSPFHKATIIKLLKEVKSAHILAIGDGFNDIAMLKEANVGVQLFHKDVPFVFGDIVISRIELLNNLIFSWGKTGLANFIVLILLNISVAFTANTLQFYYAKDASFSAPLYKDFNIVALLISLVMYIIPSSFMRIPYSKSLLIKFPMIYGEKRRITNNLAKIICFIFFYSIAESFWIFESTKYIISRRTTSTGVVYYQKFIEAHILLTIIILSAWRFHLCTSSNSVKKSIAVAAVPVIIIIGLIIADITSLVSSISLPIVSVLTDKNSLIASLHTILLPAFVEWAIIYTFKQEVLFKAYNIIHERFIEMDQEFFTQNGNDYLKKIIGGRVTNSVGFIRDIKNCYRRSKFLNQTLKNILSLDSNHSSLGLNSLTCSITDDNNKKRFDLYIGDTQAKKNTYYLFLIMIALLIEAFVYYISREDAVSSFSFKSPSLYLFTLLLIPLYASTLNDHKKNALLYCKIVGVTVLGLNITFRVMQLGSSDLGMKTFNRLFSGPLLMNYLLNFVYFVMNISIYCIFLIKKYFFSDIIVTPESINFLTDYFEIRTLSATIILHIFYILQKHKYDSIVKVDYLAKIRIKSEYTVSNEKLAILMPKFVLNRIDTSEMNNRFVADDAGDITILFCDICEFDSVIQECQDYIVEILDEVFRAFDFLCKQHGIQKIETVGKTYMSCGGLKFIEEELPEQLRIVCHTQRIVNVAKDMMTFIEGFTYKDGRKLVIKVGIHRGNCIFGILGYHKPQFSLIGDTVNLTSRHCTTGDNNQIILSEEAYEEMSEVSGYIFYEREVEMKGKGRKKTYILKKQTKKLPRGSNTMIATSNIFVEMKKEEIHRSRRASGSIQRLQSITEFTSAKAIIEIEPGDDASSIGGQNSSSGEFDSFDLDSIEDENGLRGGRKVGSDKSIRIEDLLKDEKVEETLNKPKKKLYEVFSNEESRLEKYFLQKMLDKYQLKTIICLVLMSLDSLIRELCYVFDDYAIDKAFMSRLFGLVTGVVCLSLTVTHSIHRNPFAQKYLIITVTIIRILHRFSEAIYFLIINSDRFRLEQLSQEMFITYELEAFFLNICGIFYSRDLVVFNGISFLLSISIIIPALGVESMYLVVILMNAFIFNLIDAHFHFKTEFESFTNLITIERKSLRLSQFVDRLLPKHIQDQITEPGSKPGRVYQNVTLLFADIVGFTKFSGENSARKVVEMLSRLFTEFDKACSRLGLYKLYTIGDCYVVMGFLDQNNRKTPSEEANDVTLLAISMIDTINKIKNQFNITEFNMRIGIHTGDIFGGVIGTDIVRFDIYGQDVVVANKMESGGMEGKINVSEYTRDLLEMNDTNTYSFEENKEIFVKSAGKSYMSYFLNYESNNKEDDLA